ncbi:hypothetical protein FOL47_008270 [Perkinsus chesapeaki]|uniref:Uncharacterized protein n=1 Tax=Perkinsus chesapeaki TaxID=330153 RepID=A0A7J6MU18_PERCH|nr:hypothetical protein FOL47_008270 [Perkinsus chesapeaki]
MGPRNQRRSSKEAVKLSSRSSSPDKKSGGQRGAQSKQGGVTLTPAPSATDSNSDSRGHKRRQEGDGDDDDRRRTRQRKDDNKEEEWYKKESNDKDDTAVGSSYYDDKPKRRSGSGIHASYEAHIDHRGSHGNDDDDRKDRKNDGSHRRGREGSSRWYDKDDDNSKSPPPSSSRRRSRSRDYRSGGRDRYHRSRGRDDDEGEEWYSNRTNRWRGDGGRGRSSWSGRGGKGVSRSSLHRADSDTHDFEPRDKIEGSSTVWVGSLPNAITDDELYDIMSRYGKVDGMKLVALKGFAYIKYGDEESADAAVKSLNGEVLDIAGDKPEHELKTKVDYVEDMGYLHHPYKPSPDKKPDVVHTLFVGNLPVEVTEQDIKEFFERDATLHISQIALRRGSYRQMCYAHIRFEGDNDAERAVDEFAGDKILGRNRVRLDWAQDKHMQVIQNNEHLRGQTPRIYIGNLHDGMSEDAIREALEEGFGKVMSLRLHKDKNGVLAYGYVTFEDNETAERAVDDIAKIRIANSSIRADFAKLLEPRRQHQPPGEGRGMGIGQQPQLLGGGYGTGIYTPGQQQQQPPPPPPPPPDSDNTYGNLYSTSPAKQQQQQQRHYRYGSGASSSSDRRSPSIERDTNVTWIVPQEYIEHDDDDTTYCSDSEYYYGTPYIDNTTLSPRHMRRPNEDHQFWQQRIQWEKIASKRSSIAASRVAAAIESMKRKQQQGGDKAVLSNGIRKRNIPSNRRISSLPPPRPIKTITTTPRRGNTVTDHTSTASSSSSYNYPSSASSLASSCSYLTGSRDICSSCYSCHSSTASSRGTSYTATLSSSSSSHRAKSSSVLGSPSSCLSMTSADVERLVQDEIKRAIVPLETALKEEKAYREKAEKAIEQLRGQQQGGGGVRGQDELRQCLAPFLRSGAQHRQAQQQHQQELSGGLVAGEPSFAVNDDDEDGGSSGDDSINSIVDDIAATVYTETVNNGKQQQQQQQSGAVAGATARDRRGMALVSPSIASTTNEASGVSSRELSETEEQQGEGVWDIMGDGRVMVYSNIAHGAKGVHRAKEKDTRTKRGGGRLSTNGNKSIDDDDGKQCLAKIIPIKDEGEEQQRDVTAFLHNLQRVFPDQILLSNNKASSTSSPSTSGPFEEPIYHNRCLSRVGGIRQIVRELALLARSPHTNIVNISHIYEESTGKIVVTITECDMSLNEMLAGFGASIDTTDPSSTALSGDMVQILARDLTAGLQRMHFFNIYHGRLSANNVLVDLPSGSRPSGSRVIFRIGDHIGKVKLLDIINKIRPCSTSSSELTEGHTTTAAGQGGGRQYDDTTMRMIVKKKAKEILSEGHAKEGWYPPEVAHILQMLSDEDDYDVHSIESLLSDIDWSLVDVWGLGAVILFAITGVRPKQWEDRLPDPATATADAHQTTTTCKQLFDVDHAIENH